MEGPRLCSRSRCKRALPPLEEYSFKTCEQCREQSRRNMAKKKAKRSAASSSPSPAGTQAASNENVETVDDVADEGAGTGGRGSSIEVAEGGARREEAGQLVMYEDRDALMAAVREGAKKEIDVFNGGFVVAADPSQSPRDIVQMLSMELWKSGYGFK